MIDVPAAGGRDAAHAARRRSPCAGRRTTRAPQPAAISCEPSVLPLSATTTSPSTPRRGSAAARLVDAGGERLRLVQAGHDDGQLDAVGDHGSADAAGRCLPGRGRARHRGSSIVGAQRARPARHFSPQHSASSRHAQQRLAERWAPMSLQHPGDGDDEPVVGADEARRRDAGPAPADRQPPRDAAEEVDRPQQLGDEIRRLDRGPAATRGCSDGGVRRGGRTPRTAPGRRAPRARPRRRAPAARRAPGSAATSSRMCSSTFMASTDSTCSASVTVPSRSTSRTSTRGSPANRRRRASRQPGSVSLTTSRRAPVSSALKSPRPEPTSSTLRPRCPPTSESW